LHFQEADNIGQVRDLVRQFLDRELPREKARMVEESGEPPLDVYRKLCALGVTALSVPEQYGGLGRNLPATFAVLEEIAQRSTTLALIYISDEQKQLYLPGIASGELLFSYAWTEPDIGADLAAVKTTAVRDGDEAVINGTKRFISGASWTGYFYTLVRSGAPEDRHNNISILLVPRTTPGITMRQLKTMESSHTYDVEFEDVRVPLANVLGGPEFWNRGWTSMTESGLAVERLLASAEALGNAIAAFDLAWNYSQERRQFGRPICAFQSIRHKLADMSTQLYACKVMLYHAATLVNDRKPCSVETSQAKLFICEAAKSVSLEALTIMGAYGYSKDYDLERHVRHSLLGPITAGSSAIQRNNIVNYMGLPRVR
jgi:alkylation response protein AidB-like acyl-CoA dehydrogenase